MDEFKFQLYLNKIKSLRGTKQPLRDLAIEINNIAAVYITTYEYYQFLYKQQILLRTIMQLSTAVHPIPKSIVLLLNSNLSSLVTSKHISVEQAKVLIKYVSNRYYCFTPTTLSELPTIDAKVRLINSDSWLLSTSSLSLADTSILVDSMTYLYIVATMPDSILLSKLKYKPAEELNTHISELSTQLTIIQTQLLKEQHEHTN